MPIAATLPTLQSQIKNAFNMGPAAQPDIVATMITQAVVSAVPSGLLPSAPSPIPLTPTGASAGMNIIKGALNMGPAAKQDIVAMQIAQGVSVIAPLAPPVGLSTLQSQIESALSMGPAAKPDIVAVMIAQAIVQYYLTGGII